MHEISRFIYSRHAIEEATRRKIPIPLIDSVLKSPHQLVEDGKGLSVYQSLIEFPDQKKFLLRVIVNLGKFPHVVVTVYRTSKVSKYGKGN